MLGIENLFSETGPSTKTQATKGYRDSDDKESLNIDFITFTWTYTKNEKAAPLYNTPQKMEEFTWHLKHF